MKNRYARVQILTYLFLFTFFSSTTSADIVSGDILVPETNTTTRTLGGDASFSLTAEEIPDVRLLANLFLVDAGVDVVINGTSLFTQFNDISEFGPTNVFVGTGVPIPPLIQSSLTHQIQTLTSLKFKTLTIY